jgi:hypothetical protein
VLTERIEKKNQEVQGSLGWSGTVQGQGGLVEQAKKIVMLKGV